MKNREVLIKILLMLRSNGINNEKVLLSIEKIPPHYFLHLLGNYKSLDYINFEELARLSKILQEALNYKKRLSNVLILDFKLGWYFSISSLLAKRIYGLCSDKKKIEKTEKVFKKLGLSNIFIKKSSHYLDWKHVAPFDLIVAFKSNNIIPSKYLDLLSNEGLLFFTKENIGKVSIIKCSKNKKIEKLKVKEFSLDENIIL
ncbi:MAG: hypothetical protein CFH34_00868 [Alphaproteobacteria bacterium MarineAlpha9_Bin4]|nr:hypothetical protein [Pelagibacterales bacterium]PPR26562.1 MAG: hypothetical protein CFH34_00868 [Alphaproteobacteria bacterium MarineAlpha9_Bin4]